MQSNPFEQPTLKRWLNDVQKIENHHGQQEFKKLKTTNHGGIGAGSEEIDKARKGTKKWLAKLLLMSRLQVRA